MDAPICCPSRLPHVVGFQLACTCRLDMSGYTLIIRLGYEAMLYAGRLHIINVAPG